MLWGACLVPAGSLASAPTSVFIAEGLVASADRAVLYLMAPRGIEAVRTADGRVAWRSDAADVPLAVADGRLLALRNAGALTLVVLDASGGGLVTVLPSVTVSGGAKATVGDGLGRAFRMPGATWRDGRVEVTWAWRTWYAGGPAPTAAMEAAAARAGQGVVTVDLAAGRLVSATEVAVTAFAPPPNPNGPWSLEFATGAGIATLRQVQGGGSQAIRLRAAGRSATLPDAVLTVAPVAGAYARAAVDGRSVLVGERLPRRGRNRVTIYDPVTATRIGGWADGPIIPWTFILADSRLVSVRGNEAWVDDLATGKKVWSRPLRDLAYHGSYPP